MRYVEININPWKYALKINERTTFLKNFYLYCMFLMNVNSKNYLEEMRK